jgi:hypothetical protein
MQNGAELEPFEFAIDEIMKQLSYCWYLVPLHIITEKLIDFQQFMRHILSFRRNCF